MIDVLQRIWCAVSHFHCYVLWALIEAVNLLVLALGSLVALALAAIPLEMPDAPTLPATFADAVGWVAWFFPVGTVVDIIAFFITAWIMWQAVAIALRWVKAL